MSQESVTFSRYQHVEVGLMKLVRVIFQTKQNSSWHVLFNHTLRYFISFTVVNCKLPRVTVVEINAFWRKFFVKNEQTKVTLKNSCWYEISDSFSLSNSSSVCKLRFFTDDSRKAFLGDLKIYVVFTANRSIFTVNHHRSTIIISYDLYVCSYHLSNYFHFNRISKTERLYEPSFG